MKKFFLASIVALAMGFAFVSCNQNSGPVDIKTDGTPEEVLTDIVTKAKAEGANWSVDQWKYVFKQVAITIKPTMVQLKELTDGLGELSEDEATAKLADFEKLSKDFEPLEKLMDEFVDIAKGTANGKLVSEDKDFEKQIEEEIGLPDF